MADIFSMLFDAVFNVLNVIFNFAIANHFDLIPVDILSEILPHIPTAHLEHLYEESREISDDLNDYTM